jgi:glyoxylase-like metal-dependent hydrolase (beta-lactamase superfamily II)
MTEHVDAATLREWLERGRAVTVLDIRPIADRQEWYIPGSLHLDAYEALKSGDASALDRVNFPRDTPVITVCNRGKVSESAVGPLCARGIQAASLAGGMQAWSLAWNTAEVPVAQTSASVIQVRRTGKGCLSYLILSQGSAAVIDPSLPPEIYTGLAQDMRAEVRLVLETHVHADHLSRGRLLAAEAGAEYLCPVQNRLRFPFRAVTNGADISFGGARLRALRTPGHTEESTCYVLDDAAVFTGDTLFLNSVGRPDLLSSASELEARARTLYRSLERIWSLDSGTVVLPGHASQPIPFDRVPLCAPLGDVSANLSQWRRSESEFAEQIVKRIPPTPPNYGHIVEFNEAGVWPEGDPAEFEAGANRCAVR